MASKELQTHHQCQKHGITRVARGSLTCHEAVGQQEEPGQQGSASHDVYMIQMRHQESAQRIHQPRTHYRSGNINVGHSTL